MIELKSWIYDPTNKSFFGITEEGVVIETTLIRVVSFVDDALLVETWLGEYILYYKHEFGRRERLDIT